MESRPCACAVECYEQTVSHNLKYHVVHNLTPYYCLSDSWAIDMQHLSPPNTVLNNRSPCTATRGIVRSDSTRISKLSACDIWVRYVPGIITHSSPLSIEVDLQTTWWGCGVRGWLAGKPQVTIILSWEVGRRKKGYLSRKWMSSYITIQGFIQSGATGISWTPKCSKQLWRP